MQINIPVFSTTYAQTFDTRVWKVSEENNHLSCSIWLRFLSGQVLILNPIPYTYLQFLVSSCELKRLVKSSWPWKCVWSPKEQERGHVWPLIHCIVSQKLILAGLRVLQLTGGEWMSEKLNMLSNVKLRTGLALWSCHCGNVRFAVDPGNRRRGASFSLRSCIQAHVCRW